MITMRETLSLPELQSAMVLTGKSGLSRKIRWVHVIDTEDVGHFLEGGEFLLTCGQLWPQNKESEERLLKSFLRNQISGILFATGRYLTECPPAVLEFGEKNAIPVIEVPFHVPFVKITQRIHQEIMDRHYKKIELTTRIPFELKEKLQSTNSHLDICKVLAEHLKCSIAITDTANQIFLKAFPTDGKRINIQKYINDLINDCQHLNQVKENVQSFYLPTKTPSYAIAVPMKVGGNIWGTLWLDQFRSGIKRRAGSHS